MNTENQVDMPAEATHVVPPTADDTPTVTNIIIKSKPGEDDDKKGEGLSAPYELDAEIIGNVRDFPVTAVFDLYPTKLSPIPIKFILTGSDNSQGNFQFYLNNTPKHNEKVLITFCFHGGRKQTKTITWNILEN